ncbi:MAG TPA: cytochrome c oxidase subunit II [Kofleriaceae bacterium]|nr:cytochrome c oxidase subunit II [Kofleriaceae bacterium]
MNETLRWALDLPPQASSVARGLDTLHYTVIVSAFVVAVVTFALVIVFMIKFRERADRPHTPKQVPRWLEQGLIAFTLAVFFGWWIVGFTQYRELREPPADAIRIHVVAKQWMWQFVYPNGAIAEDELRVPVGEPVELLITSRDVIHSFYVPAFRLKEDAVPGRITSMWFTATIPGEYDLLCAEYCGAGHSTMRGRVLAVSPAEYTRWIDAHPAQELAKIGERLAAEKGCLRCHSVDGTPHLAPTFRGLYGSRVPLADGSIVIADEAYLTESMMDPMAKIVRGYGPIMPSYLGQISGPDAAALVEYLRSLEETP